MNLVSPGVVALHKQITFNFSNTLRNQVIDLNRYSSAGYIVDINGMVYATGRASGDSATVIVIGGSDRFVNEKANRLASSFYISESQKVTLYKIILELSKKTDSATITSNNDKLEQGLSSLYRNYCG